MSSAPPTTGAIVFLTAARLYRDLLVRKATGQLVVRRGDIVKKVFFKNGSVLYASSNQNADRLGDVLLARGMISREHYEESASQMLATGRKQGTLLVQIGALGPKDLFRGLIAQVRDIAVSLCSWDDGAWNFVEGLQTQEEIVSLRLNTSGLLFEGLAATVSDPRWPGVWNLANLDLLIAAPGAPFVIDDLDAPDTARRLLLLVEQGRPVKDLAQLVGTAEREAAVLLYGLSLLGMIEARPRAARPAAPEAGAKTDQAAAAPAAPPAHAEPAAKSATRPTPVPEPAPATEADLVVEIANEPDPGPPRATPRQPPAQSPPAAAPEPRPVARAAGAQGTKTTASAQPAAQDGAELKKLRDKVTALFRQLESLNHYQLLGVAPESSGDTIKLSYISLAKEYHPDRFFHPAMEDLQEQANAVFMHINEAYSTLHNPSARVEYDSEVLRVSTPAARLKAPPDNSHLAREQFAKGINLLNAGDFWSAIQAFRWAVNLSPQEPRYHTWLGVALTRTKKRLHEAEEHCKTAIALDYNNAQYYVNLGLVYRTGHLFEKARKQFETALRLDPKHAGALKEIREMDASKPA